MGASTLHDLWHEASAHDTGSVGYLKPLQAAYSYTRVEALMCLQTRYIPAVDTRQMVFLHLAMQP